MFVYMFLFNIVSCEVKYVSWSDMVDVVVDIVMIIVGMGGLLG